MADWRNRVQQFVVGDRVCYKTSWLRSTGQYTGKIPHARGTITELKKLGDITLATIDWGDEDIPAKVITASLSKVTERGILDE